jgi:hypothetical protein
VATRVEGIDDVRRMLSELATEYPKAARYATNNLIRKTWEGERVQAAADFDRPTQWAVGSILYSGLKADGTGGTVYIWDRARGGVDKSFGSDDQSMYGVNVLGGKRERLKKSEVWFSANGFAPRGVVWVPTRHTPLDQYGNVPGRWIQSVMRSLKSAGDYPQFKYLPGNRNRAPGIWEFDYDAGTVQYMVLRFVQPRTHGKNYDFYGRAERDAAFHFGSIFDAEIQKAIERAAR